MKHYSNDFMAELGQEWQQPFVPGPLVPRDVSLEMVLETLSSTLSSVQFKSYSEDEDRVMEKMAVTSVITSLSVWIILKGRDSPILTLQRTSQTSGLII